MIELTCDGCGVHVGYMSDSGPHGFIYCDECYLDEQDEDDEETEN